MQIDKQSFNFSLKDIKMGFFGKMMLFTILYSAVIKFVVPFHEFPPPAWIAAFGVWFVGLMFIAVNE